MQERFCFFICAFILEFLFVFKTLVLRGKEVTVLTLIRKNQKGEAIEEEER